jgi:hypothetical protein
LAPARGEKLRKIVAAARRKSLLLPPSMPFHVKEGPWRPLHCHQHPLLLHSYLLVVLLIQIQFQMARIWNKQKVIHPPPVI